MLGISWNPRPRSQVADAVSVQPGLQLVQFVGDSEQFRQLESHWSQVCGERADFKK